jgi:uncharacterized protein YjbI with pentapeptide repeats
MTSANFAGATITYADFSQTTIRGLTASQIYATASYQSMQMEGIKLSENNLTGWNLRSLNLQSAVFNNSNLTSVDFSSSHLEAASLGESTLTGVNLTDTVIWGAKFHGATANGLTASNLYSTASYKSRELTGVTLSSNNLAGWDFRSQNLFGANLQGSNLIATDFTAANLRSAGLGGFGSSLSSANFTGADLTNAGLANTTLVSTDFTSANLHGVSFEGSILSSANFSDAIINGAFFEDNTTRGLRPEQLYSTASYKAFDLSRVNFGVLNYLAGWNFRSQNLAFAQLPFFGLYGADFTLADLRSATGLYTGLVDVRGIISPTGQIAALNLQSNETLRIRQHPTLPATALGSVIGPATSAVTLEDSADLILSPTGATTLSIGSLTLGAGAILTSNNNDILLNYTTTSPIAQLIAYLQSGQLLPSPDSAGLPTTLAIAEAADLGLIEFNGITIDDTTVIAKYTYVGDANLDGQVDALDYERIDLAIGNSGVLGTAQGDLNYDGTVDALDYEQVDLNIGNGVGAPLGTLEGSRFIPEPTLLAPLALLPLLTARRRR